MTLWISLFERVITEQVRLRSVEIVQLLLLKNENLPDLMH